MRRSRELTESDEETEETVHDGVHDGLHVCVLDVRSVDGCRRHTHARTHARTHTHAHTHTQVRHTCCSRVKQMTGDRGVEVTVVRDELLVLMAEDEHVVF